MTTNIVPTPLADRFLELIECPALIRQYCKNLLVTPPYRCPMCAIIHDPFLEGEWPLFMGEGICWKCYEQVVLEK